MEEEFPNEYCPSLSGHITHQGWPLDDSHFYDEFIPRLMDLMNAHTVTRLDVKLGRQLVEKEG